MYDITEITATPTATQLSAFKQLYEAVFEMSVPESVLLRMRMKPGFLLLLIADAAGNGIAFKAGYRESTDTFYSWLGGVLPSERGHGLAAKLMAHQHDWCKRNGYAYVRTKTRNRWRNMLILNLKEGFEIIGLQTNRTGVLEIMLEKAL